MLLEDIVSNAARTNVIEHQGHGSIYILNSEWDKEYVAYQRKFC